MTWRVQLAASAEKDLAKLERPIQTQVVKRLARVAAEGPRAFQRLAGRPEAKLRVGDYRVLALVDARGRTVRVTHVGHRSAVYDG